MKVSDSVKLNTNAITMQITDSVLYREGNVCSLVGMSDDLTQPLWHRAMHPDCNDTEIAVLDMFRAVWYSYADMEVSYNAPSRYNWADSLKFRNTLNCTLHRLYTSFSTLSGGVLVAGKFCDTPENAVVAVENALYEHFQIKIHPKARARAVDVIERQGHGELITRGDVYTAPAGDGQVYVYGSQVARLLVSMHALYSNRMSFVVGEGFKDGAPMLILAQPVFKEDTLVDWRLHEQRAAKFLQNMFGNAVDCRDLIEDLKVYNKAPQTYLCTTEEEWYEAYEHGPNSCMTDYSFECSPVRVYADNPVLRLCIYYSGELFGEGFEVKARAIVNTDTSEYVRAYGSNSDALMRALGYKENRGATNGCTLKKIRHPNGAWLMPYLDGDHDEVDEYGDHWWVCGSGDYTATEPDGFIWAGEDIRPVCDCCGDHFNEDDGHVDGDGNDVCDYCFEDYVSVIGREGYYPSSVCTYSHLDEGWVHDDDRVLCEVSRDYMHMDNAVETEDGVTAHSSYCEYSRKRCGEVLTIEAANSAGLKYIGDDADNEEDEEDSDDADTEEAA